MNQSICFIVTAAILSFLSVGNSLYLTSMDSSVPMFRLRRRETLLRTSKVEKSVEKLTLKSHFAKKIHKSFIILVEAVIFAQPVAIVYRALDPWPATVSGPPPLPPPII